MLKTFKYRIYPARQDAVLLDKHFNATRFIYNLALETKQRAYSSGGIVLSCFDLHKQLTDLKSTCPWLTEINSQSLQQSINNLDKSFNSFFKGKTQYPNFKNKNSRQSFIVPQRISIANGLLLIPKFSHGLPIIQHRPLEGQIKRAILTKAPSGKYFVSILCETAFPNPPKADVTIENTLGVDMGLKHFLITSTGATYDNPRFLQKSQSRLSYLQRISSKFKGKKTKQKITLLNEKIGNQRKDFLNKLSHSLIRDNQSIAMENLQIKNMIKNHKLSGAIRDAAWGKFMNMIKYKGEWNGRNILQIGTFEPSSKTCSSCGSTNPSLTLSDRQWECKICNTSHNRDINAAINIKHFALKQNTSVGCRQKNQNELPTLVGVMTSEIALWQ